MSSLPVARGRETTAAATSLHFSEGEDGTYEPVATMFLLPSVPGIESIITQIADCLVYRGGRCDVSGCEAG